MRSTGAILFVLILFSTSLSAGEPITLPLWPEGVPGQLPEVSQDTKEKVGEVSPSRVSWVSEPTLTVYRPEHPNGASVIVAPGGGFAFLSWKNEGVDVCDWLNSIGVTAVLLKYRTPTRDAGIKYEMPVQDAQRALGLVRHHAQEWGLDPHKVGLLGFSAGAELAGHATWDNAQRTYQQNPQYDDPQAPDFVVFIYGGNFRNKAETAKLVDTFVLPDDAPPAFFLVAHDDKENPVEATLLYLAYKQKNRTADLHIFSKGGHGFGMRKTANPVSNWPQLCGDWMQSLGFIPAGK